MKTKAHQRLKASSKIKGSSYQVRSLDVPKFRYIDDVCRFIDTLDDRLQELTSLVRVQQSAVASLIRAKVDPDKKVAPSMKKLESQYRLIQDLHELYRTVESVESQVSFQFDERSGPTFDQMVSDVQCLKAQTSEQMKNVFSFLQQVANKHVPQKFRRYMQALEGAIKIQFPQLEIYKTYLYSSVCPKGSLVFTFYMYLKGEGQFHLSLQWTAGDPCLYVQLNHEYETPDQLWDLGPGQKVQTAAEAIQAASNLLSGEGMEPRQVQAVTKIKVDPTRESKSLQSALAYF